jgi:SAM-dependent methyltransferase
MPDSPQCHSCRAVIPTGDFVAEDLPRVSSDCRPAPRSGALAVCPACGLAQTVVDERWRRAADEVYEAYDIYAAADGAEQKVAAGDGLASRSQVLVAHWAGEGKLPAVGRLLDVGCGNGSFLRAFAERFPAWKLSAVETSDRYVPRLQAIPGFENFFLVGTSEIRGRFDALSLVHVLEHLAGPSGHLEQLRGHASPDAQLLVEVPGWLDNPFALMISDHASHFTPASLRAVVQAAGWQAHVVSTAWVRKELSLLATNQAGSATAPPETGPATAAADLRRAVAWLQDVARQAGEVAAGSRNFGLFGTAIAATWLRQTLPSDVAFLVDEDPDRVGRQHLGLPILAPDDVPEGSDVFVGLSPLLSGAIARRLARPGRRYHSVAAD